MKFKDFAYQRPEMEEFTARFNDLLTKFEESDSFVAQDEALKDINTIREEFISMNNICQIRHTVDTKDAFYEAENEFFDANGPKYQALGNRFYTALTASKFRTELEAKHGKQLFVIAELSKTTFEPIILSDLQEENKLVSEYVKIKAGATITFRDKEYNLSALVPLETSQDRTTRKEASEAKWAFFEKHKLDFDRIYDEQVNLRHGMAEKLGYKNYIELGYARMLRSDYDAEMVAGFRQQILDYVVPLVSDLFERQRKRLSLDTLHHYDESFRFDSGNPKPKGNPDWIIKNAQKMYSELSPETNDFFNYMIEKDLMDLVNREGKATGGYCTFINKYEAPYIFSNFNGTSGDIDVLTHEAGHAFQVYSSKDIGLKEYNWPTYEACEIHSMSMEFFTWPWMNLFFEEDTEKYMFAHLAGALKFLPYGVAVDEFQHYVYENVDATPTERNDAWRAIEKKYMPHRNYGGHPLLEEGRFWQRQNHIFSMPFYYIDYTLAQICAFQFWKRDRENHEKAWGQYLTLCKAGGSLPFLELVKLAGLQSPFEKGCIESVIGEVRAWLDSVDDTVF